MIIFPAIDIIGGKAVRLFRGDYDRMTVYGEDPSEVAMDFVRLGADHIHIVDLEAARFGKPVNMDTVLKIKERSGVFCEIGGGIRSLETASMYLEAGMDRVILGTAAVEDQNLLRTAIGRFGSKVAVGVDLKDGFVEVRGWEKNSGVHAMDLMRDLEKLGLDTVIVTDISKDGAMQGTNRELYSALSAAFEIKILASGGVSSMEDIRSLKKMGMHGAIIGKAYYIGALDLRQAIEEAKE